MIHRVCDGCGTPLPGKKMHGFVSPDGRRVVCGRASVTKTAYNAAGAPSLIAVETPACKYALD